MDQETVARALEELESLGARGFDAASCDCIRALVERAAELDERAAAHLLERAMAHVERLRERLDTARARTEQWLKSAEATYGDLPAERGLFEQGAYTIVRRKLRRIESGTGTSTSGQVVLRQRSRVTRSQDYETSRAELIASFALARAADVVPEHAGPYNPLRIASDLLERIRDVSPLYLAAQLQRLEELGSMLSLPELPQPVRKPAPVAMKPPPRGGIKVRKKKR
jgi:exonuclease VII small subunit